MKTVDVSRAVSAAAGLVAALVVLGAAAGCARSPRATTTQTAPVASTQQAGEVRGRPDPLRNITLSDAQRAQVDSIRARYRTQLDSLRNSSSSDGRRDPDARRRFREIMDQQFADIRAVLTPDQQTVFDQNLQEMRARRRDRGRNP
jgi:Spy/CpxP family protein refolding chaperone